MGEFEAFLGVSFWTALWTLANTVALFLVLKHFLFKPVMKIIQDRQQEIDSLYTEADQNKAAAVALEREYQQKLSVAAQTSERIVKEAVERGRSREEEIIRQANEDASAIRTKAEADIAQEKKKALNDAKDEISGIALSIAEKVVERQLNDTDQDKLVNDFIDRLGDPS